MEAVGVSLESRWLYLHSGLSQIDFERQLLPGVDVRVVSLGENPLQLLQLRAGERRPDASLLSLLVQSAVIREEFVGNCKPNEMSLLVVSRSYLRSNGKI